ncbi:SAV_2336 N-terminal domain-related protein [Streptomyces sp. NPDC090088]|uniref:SAV_2336 N-terminal domain-related protein n=1 Tax=Streptomyces sp. NPDC090088 TaxID=3365944 RepID=UPI0038073E0B
MPERLLGVLRLFGEQLSVEELADVLWLAPRLPQGEHAPLAVRLAQDVRHPAPSDDDTVGAPPAVVPAPQTLPTAPEDATPVELHSAPEPADTADAQDHDGGSEPDSGTDDEAEADGPAPQSPSAQEQPRALSIRIAQPRSLSGSLSVARALRPLKRHRPDHRRREIDEAATAARVAHTGVLDVVTHPARERWLDLSLIVDDSGSMLLWQQLCTELHLLFERLGAFRQIRVWGLRLQEGRMPMLSSQPFGASLSLLPPAVADDPSGRTMTLVISDGANRGWRTGAMAALLTRWASCGPTAVIHALPPRMWPGSALSARRWAVRVPYPGAANREWRVRDTLLPTELSPFTGIAVPVLEPGPRELGTWARAVVAGGTSTVLSLWDPHTIRPDTGHSTVSSAEAVRHFRRTASPEAYRLAAHLAAIAPLTVPVMRLVAEAVPWSATTTHLSEVFLSGLMRLAENTPARSVAAQGTLSFRHSQRVFSFTDEAGDILQEAVPTAEIVETARQVSTLIGELIGEAPDFAAWLHRPDGTDLLPQHAQNFAWLGSALLRRLGLTGAAVPDWDRPPPVPEEEPQSPRDPLHLHVPFVGYSAVVQSPFPWRRLSAEDPERIGGYDLLGWAPHSGSTNVYLGRNPEGVEAAVRRPAYDAPNAHGSLLLEVVALSRFDHPCLPTLFDHEADAPRPWTAVSPATASRGGRAPHLAEVVAATGPLGTDTTLALARRLASALAHSHGIGVVHGRLAPHHILLTRDEPVIVGWHRATVDGRPPQPGQVPARPEDDVRALAEILAQAALGTDRPARSYRRSSGSLGPLDEARWSAPSPSSSVDPALHTLIGRCLHAPDGTPATATDVLALLRDRLPPLDRSTTLRAFLPTLVAELIGDAKLLRTPPRQTGRREGPQVPITPEESVAQNTMSPVGTTSPKWQILPGSAQAPGRLKRFVRRSPPPLLEPQHGPPAPCVVVIGAQPGSGRSTVAVQLASVLTARAGSFRGERKRVLMLPLDRELGVFGYRLLAAADASAVAARLPDGRGHMPSHARGWGTRTDSRGTHFLYGQVPVDTPTRLDTSAVRRGVDWLRSFGTLVVDASGTFLPPQDSLRTLLGRVDHLVVTSTTRQQHLDAVLRQIEWLAEHDYEELVRTATLVVSDVEGSSGHQDGSAGVGGLNSVVGSVCSVPHDTAMHRLGLVDRSVLASATQRAFDMLGLAVGSALASAD